MQDNQLMNGLQQFQRQFPKEAQMAKAEIKRAIEEGGAPEPEEIKEILQIAQDLQKSPARWAELRPQLIDAGMPEELLPPIKASKVQIAQIVGILLLTVYLLGQGPEGQGPEGQPEQPVQPDGLISQGV